jgi:hypothetical protein
LVRRAIEPRRIDSSVMPAHSAAEDARERAYVAGIHVLFSLRVKDVDGT